MFYIPMQALSQNIAHGGKGRRFKSKPYREYEIKIKAYLKKLRFPSIKPKEPFYLYFEFGIPYMQDLSSRTKCYEDILCDHLGINDRDVKGIYLRKIECKKSDCFIRFAIVKSEYKLIELINKGG